MDNYEDMQTHQNQVVFVSSVCGNLGEAELAFVQKNWWEKSRCTCIIVEKKNVWVNEYDNIS